MRYWNVMILIGMCGVGLANIRPALAVVCQAGKDANHAGCTASGIVVTHTPQLTTTGTLWEGHQIAFSFDAAGISDVDHCCHNVDQAETDFDISWKIEKRVGGTGGSWVPPGALADYPDKTGSIHRAYWASGGHTAALPETEGEYRMVVTVNDTPWGTGAVGNDDQVDKRSDSFSLRAPTAVDFVQLGGRPINGGRLFFRYQWEASCGHIDHLDNVTVREYVTYDGNDNPHDWSHPNGAGQHANSFRHSTPNPTFGGDISGVGGQLTDTHSPPAGYQQDVNGNNKYWVSYCRAAQEYQQAYLYSGMLQRPEHDQLNVPAPWPNWSKLNDGSIEIQRYVERDGAGWRCRVTKSGQTATLALR